MSYSAEVLADSPLAYWRLGETSGTNAADSSGNGRDATYTNTPTLGATGLLVGDADKAMTVASNSGQCATVANASWMNISALTAECWVTFSSAVDASNGDALLSRYASGTGFQWLLFRSTGGKVQLQINVGGLKNCIGTTTLASSTTYHLVATWDGSNGRVYVNGNLETTTAIAGAIAAATSPTEIGRYSLSSTTVPGATIDEAAVYGAALSGARIAAHYAAGTGTGSASGSGSLTLSGSGAAKAAATGAGSLSLSGSGAATAPVAGSGSLTLSAAGDTVPPSPASGTGSLSLLGSGAAGVGVSGSGSLTLSGAGTAVGSTSTTGTGSLSLSASGSATLADSGTGFLELSATGAAEVLYATDVSNSRNGRIRHGSATVTVDRPVAALPNTLTLAAKVDKAIAYPAPTMVDGRPT